MIDLAATQRALISDGSTGWSVGASFLAKPSSTPLNFTATATSGGTLTALQSLLAPNYSVLGGWDFTTDAGYTPGDPAYLSFGIGSSYSANGLEVWHLDGSNWSPFAANDLTYDGNYASFTVTGFSGYAVTGSVVPEPTTLAMLGTALAGMALWACKRRLG